MIKPILTYQSVKNVIAKRYIKTAVTKLRQLTDTDVIRFAGVIHSLEAKDYPFVAGDYLARGAEGEEWVVKSDFVQRTFEVIPGMCDRDGFESYRKIATVKAFRIDSQFSIFDQNNQILESEEQGGWLVWTDQGEIWICADRLFLYSEAEVK